MCCRGLLRVTYTYAQRAPTSMVHLTGNFLIQKTVSSIPYLVNKEELLSYFTEVSFLEMSLIMTRKIDTLFGWFLFLLLLFYLFFSFLFSSKFNVIVRLYKKRYWNLQIKNVRKQHTKKRGIMSYLLEM